MDSALRARLHDVTLAARSLLIEEATESLEGIYGLHSNGTLEPIEHLPAVTQHPDARQTRQEIEAYLRDEREVGIAPAEAVTKLVRETAFTWLNRLAAFKMLEARNLIRFSIRQGMQSDGFRRWVAAPGNEAEYALHEAGLLPRNDMGEGSRDTAYRHYVLHLCAEQAKEIRVLFDPDTLPSRLFPRPRALARLLDLLNAPALEKAWEDEEAIGWLYQSFNSLELEAAFQELRNSGKKFGAEDIPSVTQLFTPRFVVQYLVQNTLGRLWQQMHPDSSLNQTLDYLIPEVDAPRAPMRPVREITFLDPACGTMHFGLVAFDLFYAMYQEEIQHAGQPSWPVTPSISDERDIPAAIIEYNLYGMDIDLRAVQLSALTLMIKARYLQRDAHLTDHNLACAAVTLPQRFHLDTFLTETNFTQPIYSRLIRGLWERLADAPLLGSLMRLEADLDNLVSDEKSKVAAEQHHPHLPGFAPEQFESEAGRMEFWDVITGQVVRAFDEFMQRHADQGMDERFFTHEGTNGLKILRLMLRRYDVVVTNPPYLSNRKMAEGLKKLLSKAYPDAKLDFYAAFIQRNLELVAPHGRVGMLTMHSFMSISSYEGLRALIQSQAAIENLAHYGPALFDVGNPGTLQTAAYVLRRDPDADRRENSQGVYVRLVAEPDAEAKRLGFERAVRAMQHGEHHVPNVYRYRQGDFEAIAGAPWVYYITPTLRDLFRMLPKLGEIAPPRQGLATADNFRFLRQWWEIGLSQIGRNMSSRREAQTSGKHWFPYMKGGESWRWWGNQDLIVNWTNDGAEVRNLDIESGKTASRPQNTDYYFRRGVTYTAISSKGFSLRLMPNGFIFDHAGNCLFPDEEIITLIMALLNSEITAYFLRLLNPTVNFYTNDLERLPIPTQASDTIHELVERAIALQRQSGSEDETTYEFVAPLVWPDGGVQLADRARELAQVEQAIDEEVYRLYGISATDRAAIEAEVGKPALATEEASDEREPDETIEPDDVTNGDPEAMQVPSLTQQALAAQWVSYAVGIVLGRFQPGEENALGCGRIAVSRAATLREVVVPNGSGVLDAGHPDDLAARVEQALTILVGADQAEAIIVAAARGGDLREWLAKDFFTDHLKRYRKRPIYWLLQSPKKNYSIFLFHEQATRDMLHLIQGTGYVGGAINHGQKQLQDLRAAIAATLSPSEKRPLERQIEPLQAVLDDLEACAGHLRAITGQTNERGKVVGWVPERDDGVLINLAPLWQLLPSWPKAGKGGKNPGDPHQCWDFLARGALDWSHTSMRYWPDRVRVACQHNASYAIAHGLHE